MHVAAVAFLWLNRIYFTALLALHYLGYGGEVPRSHTQNQVKIAWWQIAGTFLVLASGRSPFHLAWWYPLGWVLLTGFQAFRRSSVA